MPFTPREIEVLPLVISAPRFSTYLRARGGDIEEALRLYRWNLEVSSALLVALQLCEVSVRNSIATAIENTYGPSWPWNRGFQISLKTSRHGYSPRCNLIDLAKRAPATSKIVAELKFIFWEQMFTARHDQAIWNRQLKIVFPNCDCTNTVQQLRTYGLKELNKIRVLRNRIAHHEPILENNIQQEYERIRLMIAWTNDTTAEWLDKIERVRHLIGQMP
ncbi:hypothetical protein FPY71_04495 [Aureimonas fodinaquatilis]|uniref:Abi family protein n=2 Tax=Aureimonas fodinaquatilis TaxID=2565783 RepID=A0A5B0E110_9HYPH|nr:hypothetical protein FPY71_04495 [Aureimonas fodinaquatilis]